MKSLVGVYGASGFGSEVMPLLKSQLCTEEHDVVFIDDGKAPSILNGIQVVNYESFLNLPYAKKEILIAIADSRTRRVIYRKIDDSGVAHKSLYALNSMVLDDVAIGENSILCPFVTITSNIKIGKSFHANLYSYVGHDCQIGDFVTFAPAVKCNGNVLIEDNVYIGTGAILKNGTPERPLVIGEGAIIGMGCIVTKSVPSGAIVAQTPSRPLARKGFG